MKTAESLLRLDQTNAQLQTHAQVLVRLVDLSERHEQVLGKLVTSVESLNARFDNSTFGRMCGVRFTHTANFLTGAHQKAHEETRRKYEELDVRVTRLESGNPVAGAPAESLPARFSTARFLVELLADLFDQLEAGHAKQANRALELGAHVPTTAAATTSTCRKRKSRMRTS